MFWKGNTVNGQNLRLRENGPRAKINTNWVEFCCIYGGGVQVLVHLGAGVPAFSVLSVSIGSLMYSSLLKH